MPKQKNSTPSQGENVLFYHKLVRRLDYMIFFFQVETCCEATMTDRYLIAEVTQWFDRKNYKMKGSKTIWERWKMIQQNYQKERTEHEVVALGHNRIWCDGKELAWYGSWCCCIGISIMMIYCSNKRQYWITHNITRKWTKQKNAAIHWKEDKAFWYLYFDDLILILCSWSQ